MTMTKSLAANLVRIPILILVAMLPSACGTFSNRSVGACTGALSKNFGSFLGADAVDCGVIEWSEKTYPPIDCADEARAAGRPFWLGYKVWGEEGFMCWAAGQDADGVVWHWWLDKILWEAVRVEVQRCESLELRRGLPNFEVSGCVDDQAVTRRAIEQWR